MASAFIVLQVHLINSNIVASGDIGSQVGGTITSDTTWTAANSPYIVTSTIIIPENVILTLEPGVTVTAQPSIGKMFLINGFIQAHGNATDKIVFDGKGDSTIFETNHPINTGSADLDYCIIKNGQNAFWFDNTGFFNLTNSELSNLSNESKLWYPAQDVYIEFNTFTNTSGIEIGTDDYSTPLGTVYIKYNLFNDNQGYIINNFASYGLSKTYVNHNSFAGTSGEILIVEENSTTADMDASQNYWGTSDTLIIDSMIHDNNDNESCNSFINYLPILDAPDLEVPIAPTPTPTPEPLPTDSPTIIPIPTPLPTMEPVPSVSPSATSDPAPSPTASSIPIPSPTPISTLLPDNSPNPQPTLNSNTLSDTDPLSTPAAPELTVPIVIVLLISILVGVIAVKIKKK
jgi:hypothetical protein